MMVTRRERPFVSIWHGLKSEGEREKLVYMRAASFPFILLFSLIFTTTTTGREVGGYQPATTHISRVSSIFIIGSIHLTPREYYYIGVSAVFLLYTLQLSNPLLY